VDGLIQIAREHDIPHIGVCDAEVLQRGRSELLRRKEAGLDNGLPFTFKNPHRSTDPQRAVAGARAIIVAARSYYAEEPSQPAGAQGRVARYAWADHYAPLRAGLRVVARRLRRDGFRAVVFADDNSIVDREVAYRAGLGWFGKNANILLPGAGSWFVLGCVVTTAPLPPADGPVPDGCGSCRKSLDACPTGAIVAPGVIDAGRCLAWIIQKPGVMDRRWRAAIGDRIYGCDDCLAVCPWNRFAREGRLLRDHYREDLDSPRLLELARLDEAGFRSWAEGTPMLRTKRRGLLRNVCVALGNVGDSSTLPTLNRLAGDTEQLIAEHARWAIAQIERRAAKT